jgi:peroxiredoxin
MKLLASLLPLTLLAAPVLSQSSVAGEYYGTAAVHEQAVPVHLHLAAEGTGLTAALVNAKEQSVASSASFADGHLLVTFNYYARTIDGTLSDGSFTGTFGTAKTRYPVTLKKGAATTEDAATPSTVPPAIHGEWEIAVHSSKGESAWQLEVEQASPYFIKAVVQRIDGDTGSLYGSYDAASQSYRVSHFTAAGAALYQFKPQPDGTLLVSNLLNAAQTDLVARRPAEARTEKLAAPTDPTQQTTVKDPSQPFVFSYPDISGKLVSSSDAQFDGKVIIVAIGGSWCPNCHDEAPMLESLYKQFHARGLEIVDLSFEEADQLKDPARLRAFIARYGITYTVLIAGDPDQLNEKITVANNLNCWPTSFFIGRDGRIREIHAGFAGPANPAAHVALERDVKSLVEKLLAEQAPGRNAALQSRP